MRVATCIYKCPVIETNGIDHKGVTFPFADGISHPTRRRVHRESAAIRENLPIMALVLEKSDRHKGRLYDFERSRPHEKRIGHTMWQAAPGGIVFTEVGLPLFE